MNDRISRRFKILLYNKKVNLILTKTIAISPVFGLWIWALNILYPITHTAYKTPLICLVPVPPRLA